MVWSKVKVSIWSHFLYIVFLYTLVVGTKLSFASFFSVRVERLSFLLHCKPFYHAVNTNIILVFIFLTIYHIYFIFENMFIFLNLWKYLTISTFLGKILSISLEMSKIQWLGFTVVFYELNSIQYLTITNITLPNWSRFW